MSHEFYGFDDEDFDDEDFDGCEHGVGFDEDCEDCEDDPLDCLFPGRCLMLGEHLLSECHTAEMIEQFNAQRSPKEEFHGEYARFE